MSFDSTSPAEVGRAPRRLLRGLAPALAVIILALPIATLIARAAGLFSAEILTHLVRTVIPPQVAQGALAAVGAASLGALLALGGLATGLFDFPGRAALDRALLAPLLLPTWFLAVVYREVFDARGATWLALTLGVGAAPLFHLLGTAALRDIPSTYADVLRQSGRGHGLGAARHLGPLALPALGSAAALAALLAWSDAPSARVLAVPTLAVGMLDQWSAREDAATGALLGLVVAALSVLAAALVLAALSRLPLGDDARLGLSRGRRLPLQGASALVPWLLAAPQIVLGVVVPARAIAVWSAARLDRVDLGTLGADAARTLLLALAGTALGALLALPLLHASSLAPRRWASFTSALTLLSFALPSTVLGAAVLWSIPGRGGPAALVHATLLPLVAALGVRFAAVFLGAGRAALQRRGRDHLVLLRLLGHTGLSSFLGLLRPFLARPVAAAAAFVFLEILKDVHLTVLLAPFGFQSISARVFQLAQAERVRDCAVWMLCLALVGIYPVMTLARLGDTEPR